MPWTMVLSHLPLATVGHCMQLSYGPITAEQAKRLIVLELLPV